MHLSALYAVVFLETGFLFAGQPPAPPPANAPAPPSSAGPLPDAGSLPSPRPLSQPMAAGTIVEEPAPAPHVLPNGSVAPPGMFREEAAPMPRPQTQMPAHFFMPNGPRDPSAADVEALHRELEAMKRERESMLAEELDLTTAKDMRSSQTAQADLRKRLTELLAKTAQQARKEREAALASPPARSQAARGNERLLPTPANRLLPSPSSAAGASGSPASAGPDLTPRQPTQSLHPTTTPKHLGESAKMVTDAPVDPLSLAQSLFRVGEYATALNTYRKLDLERLPPEERIAIQYMMACCLRKLDKLDESSILYREVANATDSEFLAENAQWYLRAMRERRDVEGQLAELRQRRQAVMPRKP